VSNQRVPNNSFILASKLIAINDAGEGMEVSLRHATVTLVCSGVH